MGTGRLRYRWIVIAAAMPARQVLPFQRQGTVTAKAQGKAELVYTHSGYIDALVDIEAAGASTKIAIMGAYTAPLERGIRSWISGGTSCPAALETPLGIY